MTAKQFKTELKKIKESLKGVTLQFRTKNSTIPHFSLNSFGNSVLEQESFGMSFGISQAWTDGGIVQVSSFKELIELFTNAIVTGVSFNSYTEYNDLSTSMRAFGSLD